MTGLRKRVYRGFGCIVLLLVFSGMVSMLELGRLSRDAGEIFGASSRNAELAQEMFDAAQNQHTALMHVAVLGQKAYADSSRVSAERLSTALAQAREEIYDSTSLDSLSRAVGRLRATVDSYLDIVSVERNDSSVRANVRWYTEEYEGEYLQLHQAIKNYFTSMQGTLAPRTELLKKNAYRAVMPVLVSVVVTILIVLMFFYFVNGYGVKPLVEMNKRLDDYLNYKLPFTVKGDFVDEIAAIKGKIDVLITRSKKRIDE